MLRQGHHTQGHHTKVGAMAGSLQSIVISDADALSSVENDWWDLWSRSPAATVFQSPAWLIPWWQIFEPGSLRMIAIHQGKRLVGLARRLARLWLALATVLDNVLVSLGGALKSFLRVDSRCARSLEDCGRNRSSGIRGKALAFKFGCSCKRRLYD